MKKWNVLWILAFCIAMIPASALGADSGSGIFPAGKAAADGQHAPQTASLPFKSATYIHVSQPMEAGVYAPGPIPVAAAVYGGEGAASPPLTVNLLEGDQLLTKLGEGLGAVELSLDAASYTGKALTLQFLSDNGMGQVMETKKPIYIEKSPRLRPVATVGGEIVDVDEQRLLWVDERGRLILKQRGTSQEAVIYDAPGLVTSDQRLVVDGGVLFLAQNPTKPASRLLYLWRDGQLRKVVSNNKFTDALLWNVAGDWAAFTIDDDAPKNQKTSSAAYNLKTGESLSGTGSHIESMAVGTDGTMVYVKSGKNSIRGVFVKEPGALERLLVSDKYQRFGPPYFYGDTLYINDYGILKKDPASGQYKQVSSDCNCANGGGRIFHDTFDAFIYYEHVGPSIPASSIYLVDKRMETEQKFFYSTQPPNLKHLSEDGELAFEAEGRIYLKTRSHAEPLFVSSQHGRMLQLGGTWYNILGNTLYEVNLNEDAPKAPEWPAEAALTVSDIQPTSAKLQWLPIPGTAEYVIYADAAEMGRVDGTLSKYILSGLNDQEHYKVVIIAVDELGQRSTPLRAEFRTLPKPAVMTMGWNANTLRVGSVLEWTISAKEAQDMDAFKLKVKYNPQIVKLQGVTVHPDLGEEDKNTELSTATPSAGELEITGAKPWGPWPKNDPVGFIVVKFEVVHEGKADFTISEGSNWKHSYQEHALPEDFTMSLYSPDTLPPVWVAPEALSVTSVTYQSASLSWSPAADDIGVQAYHIYNGDQKIGTVSGDVYQYELSPLQPESAYTFSVAAEDLAGNVSTNNPSVHVTTPAKPAAVRPKLTLSTKAGYLEAGSVVEVKIRTDEVADLYAFMLQLNYDPAKAKLKQILLHKDFGTENGTAILAKNLSMPGQVGLSGTLLGQTVGHSGSYGLVTLQFTVLSKGELSFLLQPVSQFADSQGAVSQLAAPVQLTVHAGGADVNGDGLISQQDVELISSALGTSQGQPGYKPEYDLTNDGIINETDVRVVTNRVTNGV